MHSGGDMHMVADNIMMSDHRATMYYDIGADGCTDIYDYISSDEGPLADTDFLTS